MASSALSISSCRCSWLVGERRRFVGELAGLRLLLGRHRRAPARRARRRNGHHGRDPLVGVEQLVGVEERRVGAPEDLTQRAHRHHGEPVGLARLDVEVEVRRAGVRLVTAAVGGCGEAELEEQPLVGLGEPEALVEVGVAHDLAADQVGSPRLELDVRRRPREVLVVDPDLQVEPESLVPLQSGDDVGEPGTEPGPRPLDVPDLIEPATAHPRSPAPSALVRAR